MVKSNPVQEKMLKLKLQDILDDLDDFQDFLSCWSSKPNEKETEKLKLRLSEVYTFKTEYIQAINELNALDVDTSEYLPKSKLKGRLEDLITDARLMIQEITTSKDTKSSLIPNVNGSLSRALPKLQIPQFFGKIGEYVSFISNFKSIIDTANLDTVQKFLYLKSALKGESSTSISGLPVAPESYELSLNLLDARYNKPKLIIQSHISNIFNLNSVAKASPSSLQSFVDELNKNLSCLRNLNVSDDTLASALLSHIVEDKLDIVSKEKLKRFNTKDILSIADLIKFLQDRVFLLTDMGIDKDQTHSKGTKPFRSNSLVASETKKLKCMLCKADHAISKCSEFLSLSVNDRIKKVKELRICPNCLGHFSSAKCFSKYTCFQCNMSHHTLLHIPKASSTKTETSEEAQSQNLSTVAINSSSEQQLALTSVSNSNTSIVLLSTAEVIIRNSRGVSFKVRCLLDNGSMNNLISSRLVKKLGLNTHSIHVSLVGVAGQTTAISKAVDVAVHSQATSFKKHFRCLVLEKIASPIPAISYDVSQLVIPANIKLADPKFNISADIDLLIGAAHFYDLLCVGQILLADNGPSLQKTKLGYIITGQFNVNNKPLSTSNCLLATSDENFELQSFWELENIPTPHPRNLFSKDERYCESYFDETVTRASDGKFLVSIPFNSNIKQLGSSYDVSLKRFISLEKRLDLNKDTKQMYHSFIREYASMGHLSPVSLTELDSLNFLPHHEVLRPSSTTTKLRVVFDGSFKTTSGLSLNDCQLGGPVVQRDLFSILLNFRFHAVAFTADCTKMYRQMWVVPEDRRYQCILWRDNSDEPVKAFQLNTITYGLKSSSYLATKCMQRLACENINQFPEASSRILNDFYMDDLISGADSVEKAAELIKKIVQILSEAGIPLCKFCSNVPSLFSNEMSTDDFIKFSNTSSKALGIRWHPASDTFQLQLSVIPTLSNVTKRQILSALSRLFDPLGLVSPLIIIGKLLIQEIWKLNLSWDETLPMSLQGKWKTFETNLSKTNMINFPRHIFFQSASYLELHGFCDASTYAYGACIYVRTVFSDRIEINLLCSKSRVAPVKPVTLPRLELTAAVLLAELFEKVLVVFPKCCQQFYYWTDSQIVISWLNSAPNRFKTFVANRISVIQELSNSKDWFHCRSEDNPADLISRGCSVESLYEKGFWFHGPIFLRSTSFKSIISEFSTTDELPEAKSNIISLIANQNDDYQSTIITKYSSFTKLIRVNSYILRFVQNCRLPSQNRQTGRITTTELTLSTNSLIRHVQKTCFLSEINLLQATTDKLCKNQHLRSLNLFLDEKHLLRVGGRIRHSHLLFEKLHPLLLPKGHAISKLIISHYHVKYLHCGSNQLLALVRERFWPLSGRNLCKEIVRNCLPCFRTKPNVNQELMGDLPSSRFALSQPCFANTGVDFAGPIMIRDRYTRNSKYLKSYIALFICFTTRAVHLELITSLTSDAFVEAFKRFISRRGKPQRMFSDNATNFIGAANALKELYQVFREPPIQNKLYDFLSEEGITWSFIPPGSPHFGGLWESNIKQTKLHLIKVLRDAKLNFENLYTVLVQIENVLNSRPLSPLSADPSDFEPLTPSHFLLGRSATAIPDQDITELPGARLDLYQRRQLLIQHFWNRWKLEILPEMQRRTKWQTSKCLLPIRPGLLVLVNEPNTPPFKWPLARVQALHSGQDGKVRVVTLRSSSGAVFKRPLVKICPLPLQ